MIEEAYLNALLSDAAYTDFGATRGKIPDTFSNFFISKRGFSQQQFSDFTDRFYVVDHIKDPVTGFSATLFRDDGANDKLTLAIAGTELSDPGDFVQNYLILAGVSLTAGSFGAWQVGLLDTFLLDNGLVDSQGNATYLNEVNITGHSLGGHLSLVAAYKYPDLVDEVYTFNGAGLISTDVPNFEFAYLDSMWANIVLPVITANSLDTTRVNNYFGEAGDEIVASDILFDRPGSRQGITIEDHGIPDTHYMQYLVDGLGLYRIFSAIDPTLDTEEGFARIKSIIDGISSDVKGFVETGLSDVSELFQLTVDPSDAQAIINKLQLANTTYSIQSLRNESEHDLYTIASADNSDRSIGYRYALTNLMPFAVTSNISNTAAADPAYALENTSDQYLADRAHMLASLLYKNDLNLEHGPLSQPTRFSDLQSGVSFDGDHLGHPPLTGNDHPYEYYVDRREQLSFGSASADTWATLGQYTSNNDDHLYGMNGNDTINGFGGDDHIEGGMGNDSLHGGEGSDTLFGSDGADQLYGGLGSDFLVGGEGSDSFYWNNGDGEDWIGDADTGGDTIWVNGVNLATLNFAPSSPNSSWYYDSANPGVSAHHAGGELTIFVGSVSGAGKIHVSEYNQNSGADFGIALGNFTAPPPEASDVIVQTLGTALNNNEVDWDAWFRLSRNQNGVDWENATITFVAADVANYTGGTQHGTQGGAFFGGPQDDLLTGDANSNALHGLAGNDRILGAAGNDFLEGFAGSDQLEGGAGSDFLFGSANLGWEERRLPVHAGELYIFNQITDAPQHSNTLDGGAGDDFISGGTSVDFATGGTGRDYLFGGSGDDFLNGGEDGDVLFGDSTFSYRYGYEAGPLPNQYTPFSIHEIAFSDGTGEVQQFDDLLSGGPGDDILWGELGNDTLLGDAGNDLLMGDREYTAYFDLELPAFEGTSPALNSALHGDDELFGGEGSDTLYGFGGDDVLAGGADPDALIGGAGDDTYVMRIGDNQDFIIDSEGQHTLVFQGVQAESLFVAFQGDFAHVGIGDITSTDRFILPREEWDNTLIALNSRDNVIDRARLYSAYANADREVLIEIPGIRGISEAERDAVFTVEDSDPDRPRIVLESGASSAHIAANFYDVEEHRMRLGAVPISGGIASTGFTLDLKLLFGPQGWADFDWSGLGDVDRTLEGIPSPNLQGGFGNDHITGTLGADEIFGNGGSDILEGLEGDDSLYGGSGSNILNGGHGSDHLEGGPNAWYEFGAGHGHDYLVAPLGARLNFRNVAVDSVAFVYTGTDDSSFNIVTSGNTVTATGATTIDSITWIGVNGVSVPVQQRSNLQNGVFFGSRLNDIFDGGSGDDTIHANAGGQDTYLFGMGDGDDTIVESESLFRSSLGTIRFSSNVDLLDLSFEFDALTGDGRIFYGNNQIHLDGGLDANWHNPLALFTVELDAAPGLAPVIRAAAGSSGAWLYGSYGTDNIISDERAHVIRPGYGDDLIQAGGGDDYIFLADHYLYEGRERGIGNKVILGGTGDDTIVAPLHQGLTFVYDPGDGLDTINYDWSYTQQEQAYAYDIRVQPDNSGVSYTPRGEDTLSFGAGITLDDLDFTRLDADLEIAIDDGQGGILIKNFFLAYDIVAPPDLTPSELEALGSESFVPNLLTRPHILGLMPDTPIQWLQFASGDPLLMTDILSNRLTEFAVRPDITQLGSIRDDTIVGDPDGHNVIQSRGGNDSISIVGGTNYIDSGTGDDSIIASGNNTILAGSGDDNINLSGGANHIETGDGNDAVYLDGGDNYLDLGNGDNYTDLTGGNNTLHFGAYQGLNLVGATITPTSTLVIQMANGLVPDDVTFVLRDFGGGPFVDMSVAQTNATLFMMVRENGIAQPGTLRTADEVRFSNGTILSEAEILNRANAPVGNTLVGTAGIDSLIGTAYADTLDGLGGNDDIRGEGGNDTLQGGTGDDVLHGGPGNDLFSVTGTAQGYDRVIGGAGFDILRGSNGNDLFGLTALSAADSLERIDGGEGVFDVVFGDDNANTLDFSATELVGILAIGGANGDDVITGTTGDDLVLGGEGNDTITGGSGNDELRGDAGDDLFVVAGVAEGFDQVIGGAGFDTLLGGSDNDVFGLSGLKVSDSLERIDGGGGVFNVVAGDSSDNHLDFSATDIVNILALVGGAGNDTVIGSGDDDIINGDSGNDVLMGAAGNDRINGGAGDDLMLFEGVTGGYDQVNGGDGFDTLMGSSQNDLFGLSQFSVSDSIERIDGNAAVFNVVSGDNNNNNLDFSATELVNILAIVGGQGADTIVGSLGNDIINGDSGDDILTGSGGDDILSGGQGDDLYRFSPGDGADLIRNADFSSGSVDTVEISEMLYDELWFTRQGSNLVVDFVGTNDSVSFENWYVKDDAQVDSFYVDDRVLQRNQVDQLVTAMAAYDPPAGAGSTIPFDTRLQLEPTLSAVWQAA